jgi:outer membrane protein OmpA-like peptidoglycan-associated protein
VGERDDVAKLDSDLRDAQEDLKKAADELGNVREDLADKSKQLDKAIQLAKRREDVAKKIMDNFKNSGIDAEVDRQTGDVILDFGDDYFNTDSHALKSGMKTTLRGAIPVYAESLFGTRALSSEISSVEIIGFASPTYAGKPIDPTSLSIKNRTAVNYNLDLSYRRARSIFDYVFNTKNMKFNHQNTMLSLINVTGRSFFSEEIKPGDTGNLSIDEFCGQYNCKQSQRVIIKFGLLERGDS